MPTPAATSDQREERPSRAHTLTHVSSTAAIASSATHATATVAMYGGGQVAAAVLEVERDARASRRPARPARAA